MTLAEKGRYQIGAEPGENGGGEKEMCTQEEGNDELISSKEEKSVHQHKWQLDRELKSEQKGAVEGRTSEVAKS